MEKFTQIKRVVVPIDRPNVDTDAIIPKQFLKSIKRTGFGPNLFDEWRYLDAGVPGVDNSDRPLNTAFSLNKPRYAGAGVLLARENFGCGSSREHAPWALYDYGIRAIIAPSFADIFFNNSCKNGLLPIVLDSMKVDQLFLEVEANPGYELEVDLEACLVTTPAGNELSFDFDDGLRFRLLNGLDDIGITLQNEPDIRDYEDRRMKECPWLFS
ncbi:MAG: 3-isopropylmalate dehydratase small subunit [Proteobacteria bacterium]|jgi:3-isopropylmalate/(R)-2-methylmalate dehydratase small subunit|nr:3-isopropylmalate dehydratase small subunit [Pseudomonadota bacterium]MBT5066012.1 3-isopropylmalate dehydratase small subunit [Pseudomonadota bacterium]MBT6193781.1 3-isopropylmalate dehydratase small subunit [Pseudomonadota bacterium]MBT6464671.1 3-isopropylmalate dehydratase small subunit [Pseudomonadota bacterium]MBT6675417.1 3-isopropylmalate dehydratase small subunit [Pseudomonadota bacterium]